MVPDIRTLGPPNHFISTIMLVRDPKKVFFVREDKQSSRRSITHS